VSAPSDRRLFAESRAARAQLALAAALGLGMALAVVAQASLLAHVIASAAVRHVDLAALELSLAVLAAVILARALLSGAFETSGRLAATRVMSELRARLAQQLLYRAPLSRAGDRTGELAAAAVQGVDALESFFAGYLPQLVLGAAVPIAVLVWLLVVDPIAAGVLAVTVPLLIVFMVLAGKGAKARANSRWRALALLSAHFLDVVRGLPTLRAYRREVAQAQTIETVSERYRVETMGTLRIAFLSALVLELCAMIGTALAAATVGVQLDDGYLSLQAGLTVLLLAPELYAPLRAVGQQFHASADATAAAERIFAVLDEPAAIQRRPTDAGRLGTPDPAVEPVRFEAVSFAYPDRSGLVLDGLDLELASGEMTGLVGASGSGKSTLAALALRLADPTAGRVLCGDVDVRDLGAEDWWGRVAWVPQRAQIFTRTIAENVALFDPGASPGQIAEATSLAGLDELIAGLPDGLETRIGEGARRLSAGQAQRVALARAFVRDPSLLVLDEPTAHLDSRTAASVGAAIARLARGRTTLLIAHDPQLAARADRVYRLEGGRARPVSDGSDVALAVAA